ncbi:MAG TPA: FKBP-type peptidyl-prolyl cis-trans isomerase [Capillimicrobium sp.]|jgi:FKBP-type peptidyl-prolyl cis-trans isomerase
MLLRRLALLPALLLAVAVAPAPASAAFTFPKVGARLGAEPSVGKGRDAAPQGLRTKDVVRGDGRRAQTGDVLTVHYVGVLYGSGRPFDASWDAGSPFAFQLGAGGVIRGWDEGLRGMRVGGRRTLVLPPRFAYGRAGRPPAIPRRATLTFAVDLLRVQR